MKKVAEIKSYTVNELWHIRQSMKSRLKLPNCLFNQLKQLHLLKPVRGCRAGKQQRDYVNKETDKQRVDNNPLPVRITSRSKNYFNPSNVNKDNIVPVQKDPISQRFRSLIQIPLEKKPPYKTLTVGYMNARSVRNKALMISDFIVENKLDVLCVAETWLRCDGGDEPVCTEMTPQGYKLLHVPRSKGKGGGVAMVYKASLKCKRRKIPTYTSFDLVEVLLTTKSDCVRCCAIYRPPCGGKYSQPLSVFLQEFEQYIDSHATSSGKLLVIGDFNIHLDNENHPDAIKFRELLDGMDLNQHVKGITHNCGHTLDLVITRSCEKELVSDVKTRAPTIKLDHQLLLISCCVDKPAAQKQIITCRNTKDINIEAFKRDLLSSPLITSPAADITELVDQYNSTLTALMDSHAPKTTKEILIRQHSPWYNEDLAAARRKRRQAERRYMKSNLTVHREIACHERSSYNKMCKSAKISYYHQKISECEDDTSKLFQITDVLIKGKQERVLPSHDCPEALANDFVAFFSDKIKKISATFPAASGGDATLPKTPNLASFQPVTEKQVKEVIMAGNSKSCALDPMPTKLLKECLDVLLPPLVNIINTSTSSSKVPHSLKTAIVTPLLKKTGSVTDDVQNYRPVSSLPFVSKIIEKCVVSQLDLHIKTNNLEESHQSAYRKHHSTETALLRITNDLLLAKDQSQCSVLVMLDQSAAFDTINQDLLMQRFETRFGITGSAHAWLDSYFKHRTQAVVISGKSSEPRELVTGFPQGSVLGPFSYPAYTSPLFAIARKYGIEMHMYADDTQLHTSFAPSEAAESLTIMEKCLEEIGEWMAQNHLKLNQKKTEVIVIGSPSVLKRCKIPAIRIGHEHVCPTESARNIGVILDSNLNMAEHIRSVTKACYLQLYKIGQIRPYLTEDAATTLARSLIISKLDYANSLLYGLPDTLLNKLQMILNNAARLTKKKNKHDHITPLLKELHWLPVEQRIIFKTNMITYKAMNNLAPGYICELIQPYETREGLRSASETLLQPKRSRLKCGGDRAYSVCAPKLWKDVPEHIRTSQSLDIFKNSLKTHLFTKVFK